MRASSLLHSQKLASSSRSSSGVSRSEEKIAGGTIETAFSSGAAWRFRRCCVFITVLPLPLSCTSQKEAAIESYLQQRYNPFLKELLKFFANSVSGDKVSFFAN